MRILLLTFFVCLLSACGNSDKKTTNSTTISESAASTSSSNPTEATKAATANNAQLSKEERLEMARQKSYERLSPEKKALLDRIRAEKQSTLDQRAKEVSDRKEKEAGTTTTKTSSGQVSTTETTSATSSLISGLDQHIRAGKLDNTKRFVLDQVRFDSATGKLKPISMTQIQAVADVLKIHSTASIGVLAFCEQEGKAIELSKITNKMASAVASELQKRGIAKDRCLSKGMGNGKYTKTAEISAERIEIAVTKH